MPAGPDRVVGEIAGRVGRQLRSLVLRDQRADVAARQLIKLLRGARPADVPIEQPTKFELVVNMQTAKALGLTVPTSFQVLADHLIE